MDASLRVLSGPLAEQTIPVPRGKLLIGREADCDLRPDSELISRYHCVFLLDDFALRVRDLGSRNGTYVGGHRIGTAEVILLDGDKVQVGEMVLQVGLRQAAPESKAADSVAQPAVDPSALQGTGVFDGDTLLAHGPTSVPPLPASTPPVPIPVSPNVVPPSSDAGTSTLPPAGD